MYRSDRFTTQGATKNSSTPSYSSHRIRQRVMWGSGRQLMSIYMAPPRGFLIQNQSYGAQKPYFCPFFDPSKRTKITPLRAFITGLGAKFKNRLGGAIYMLMSYLPLPYMTLCLFRCGLQEGVLEVLVAPLLINRSLL